ncbi:Uncharacterised protein [Acinetobacter pittii]|nr:hypothetical protein OH685_06210 [Acinetobacter pittii]SSP28407.1 Uncharacterised protein [Acinetobacter pittii]
MDMQKTTQWIIFYYLIVIHQYYLTVAFQDIFAKVLILIIDLVIVLTFPLLSYFFQSIDS